MGTCTAYKVINDYKYIKKEAVGVGIYCEKAKQSYACRRRK